VIVNADDERLAALSDALTCSARHSANFCAENVIYYGEKGCGYKFSSELYRFGIVSRIPGKFTVMNTLLAASCAALLGIEPEYIKEGIYRLSSVPGRMERVALPDGAKFSLYIDYAHTPDALLNLLMTVKGFTVGKIILVFGCGGERDRGKRPEMAEIASRLADKIIITSDNCRREDPDRIFFDILSGISASSDHVLIRERAEAIEYAVSIAEEGDTVLLAGKGHEKYEINSNGKIYFNEAEIAQKAVKKKIG
jgi:UDP-N-acetylmuramoyl-L-alanyl-D-glutamate--2,6-diaminopimelate ligase